MGENLLGAVHSFTEYMAEHPEVVGNAAETGEQTNYFDVLVRMWTGQRACWVWGVASVEGLARADHPLRCAG
eukprot:361264-Chlamydomonas_euryale.AAC.2